MLLLSPGPLPPPLIPPWGDFTPEVFIGGQAWSWDGASLSGRVPVPFHPGSPGEFLCSSRGHARSSLTGSSPSGNLLAAFAVPEPGGIRRCRHWGPRPGHGSSSSWSPGPCPPHPEPGALQSRAELGKGPLGTASGTSPGSGPCGAVGLIPQHPPSPEGCRERGRAPVGFFLAHRLLPACLQEEARWSHLSLPRSGGAGPFAKQLLHLHSPAGTPGSLIPLSLPVRGSVLGHTACGERWHRDREGRTWSCELPDNKGAEPGNCFTRGGKNPTVNGDQGMP